jgi:hypothetical protein
MKRLAATFALLMCGSTAIAQPPTWKTFLSKDGQFSVLLPARPVFALQKGNATADLLINSTHTYLSNDASDAGYLVSYNDYPAEWFRNRGEAVLNTLHENAKISLGGKLLSEAKITLDGSPGWEIVNSDVGNKREIARTRIVLANNRTYQVSFVGPRSMAFSAETNAFLASLKIIKIAPPPETWVAVDSVEGRYRIRMPGKPELSVEDAGSKHPLHLSWYVAGEDEDAARYAVGYSDLDAAYTKIEDIENALDVGIRGLTTRLSATIETDSLVSVDGYPGRQLQMRIGATVSPIGRICILRAFVVKDRIYQVIVISTRAALARSLSDDFLDAFQLTSPAQDLHPKTLFIGDHAPAIEVAKFIRGEPISTFEKGKIYVVAFWSSQYIGTKIRFPSLNRVLHKYNDVTFIGIFINEREPDKVEPFVAGKGNKIEFSLALDKIPPGNKYFDGVMEKTWVDAARCASMDRAVFIVDRDGIVAWIGDALEMDGPMEKIALGVWDLKAATATMAKSETRFNEVTAGVNAANEEKEYAKELAILDASFVDDIEVERWYFSTKLGLLFRLGRDDEAARYLDHLVDGILSNDPHILHVQAWELVDPIVNPKKRSEVLIKSALKASMRADELVEGADADVADILSLAYFAAGKKELAISTAERALANGPSPEDKRRIEEHLANYRK